jgi:YbbR domain-containing protein
VTVTGDYQNGWYRDWYIPSPSVDPALISVNGPRSLVQTISRARVFLDPDSLDWTEESVLTTGEIKLYNRAGELVESPLLGITTESLMIDSVLIEASALPTKAFSTEEQIGLSGSVRDGYRVVSMKISPETVRVAAKSEILEQLDDLPLDQYIIDLQTLQEGTTVFNIKVQKPSEDAVLSNDTVIVTLEVEKVEE